MTLPENAFASRTRRAWVGTGPRHPGSVARTALLVFLTLFGAVGVSFADTVLVPQLRLLEHEPGDYSLEGDLSPLILGRIRPVALPLSCVAGEPEIARQPDGMIRWSLDFECGSRVDRTSELYLPWTVDGIRLDVRWADGSEYHGLFGREGLGIPVPLRLVMDPDLSFTTLMRKYGVEGLEHFFGWPHLILTLVLALSLSLATGTRVLAGITAGHALALVGSEVGVLMVPTAPAEASVAAAALAFAAALSKGNALDRDAMGMGLLVGVVHGLGLASGLADSSESTGALVPALFFVLVGLDVTAWLVLPPLTLAARRLWSGRTTGYKPVVWGAGTASVFVALLALRAGLAPPPRPPAAVAVAAAQAQGPPVALAGAVPNQLTATGRLASPILSYLTIEPYQTRLEVLISMRALEGRGLVRVGSDGVILPEDQPPILERAIALTSTAEVTLDDDTTLPSERFATFVTVDPNGVNLRTDPVAESVQDGIVGVTLTYETEGLPERLVFSWPTITDDATSLPLMATDPSASREVTLSAEDPALDWRNTLGDFRLPDVEQIRTQKPRVPLPSVALALAVISFAVVRRRRGRSVPAAPVVAALVLAYALYPFARVSAAMPLVTGGGLTADQASNVLAGLLTNVYRSFDIHDEEAIYDRLSLTVTGDQLLDVYLESRRALELENRGGARVRVDEVAIREVRSVTRNPGGGFAVDAQWTVGGSVSHFGHEHFRQNRYDAVLTLVASEGTWKIGTLELLEERRLM